MAKPVQELGKSPFRRIHSATPINCFQSFTMGGDRDFGGLSLGSMIAPQIVFAERLDIFADRNHRRSGCIESDCLYLITQDAGITYRLARGGGNGGLGVL